MVTTFSMTTFKQTNLERDLAKQASGTVAGQASGEQADNDTNCSPRAVTHYSNKHQRHNLSPLAGIEREQEQVGTYSTDTDDQ